MPTTTDSDYYASPEAVGPPASFQNVGADEAATLSALKLKAQQQQTIANQQQLPANGDWRVKLSLAKGADYLYNAVNPGILRPLADTGGVIFPYTPAIDTAYRALYDAYSLTHSNYRGYFYNSSYVDAIQMKATFTAQNTFEANYMLAVIHFFRSATKMFYGQDAQRGSPPPLVFLSGLGQYQFNNHPCLIQNFQYSLPDNIDYIRSGPVVDIGLNLSSQRPGQSVSGVTALQSIQRLATAITSLGGAFANRLAPGALPQVPSPSNLSNGAATYVPTKIEVSLTLLPVQSRQAVSQQFSVKEFANGNLLKGGFW